MGIRGCHRAVQRTGQGADAHLAGGSPCAACTDHGISDARAPVLPALIHCDQRQSHLL